MIFEVRDLWQSKCLSVHTVPESSQMKKQMFTHRFKMQRGSACLSGPQPEKKVEFGQGKYHLRTERKRRKNGDNNGSPGATLGLPSTKCINPDYTLLISPVFQ